MGSYPPPYNKKTILVIVFLLYNGLGLEPERAAAYKTIRGIVFRTISNEAWRANKNTFEIRKPLAGIVRSGLPRVPPDPPNKNTPSKGCFLLPVGTLTLRVLQFQPTIRCGLPPYLIGFHHIFF